jgi:hypothetical protein
MRPRLGIGQALVPYGSKRLEMADLDRPGLGQALLPEVRTLARGVKTLEKNFVGPGTLGRTWGTRPETLERNLPAAVFYGG